MVKLITGFLVVSLLMIASVGDSRTLRVAQDGTGDFIDVFRAVQAA